MKTVTILKFLAFIFIANYSNHLNSQIVTIPDPNFATAISTQVSAGVIIGNQLDIVALDAEDINYLDVSSSNISDLSGIEFFIDLYELNVSGNNLYSIDTLPIGLNRLICNYCSLNNLESIINLNDLDWLEINNNSISSLSAFPMNVEVVFCTNNLFNNLPDLPNSMSFLSCSNNALNNLPNLNSNLQYLYANNCNLIDLPLLPLNIKELSIANNQFTNLPIIPISIERLDISHNPFLSGLDFTTFVNLNFIDLTDCQLLSIPQLPNSLTELFLGHNYDNQNNQYNNQITTINNLPNSILYLNLCNSSVENIINLPESIWLLELDSSNVNCLPYIPNTLEYMTYVNTNINCIPNYTENINPQSSILLPLCDYSNINNCVFQNISGKVFNDQNNNCLDDLEINVNSIQINLKNDQGDIIESVNSCFEGNFGFNVPNGDYTLELANLPNYLETNCTISNPVDINLTNPFYDSVQLAINCNGFDTGVETFNILGWVFPNQTHELRLKAGDLAKFTGVSCALENNNSSNVSITFQGPISSISPMVGALIPTSISGNTFNYIIDDFSSTNIMTDFAYLILIDSTATSLDEICIHVNFSNSVNGDVNLLNNDYNACYNIVNSYDPNVKIVDKKLVNPNFQDELLYTIYFQNTGNAPAFNIRLEDTLSSKLDLNSFRIINYSHYNEINLNHNSRKLTINFPNIMLVDSTTNFLNSIGFFQYSIKPTNPLEMNESIDNRAFIYFDFNSPINTNYATTISGYLELIEPLDNGKIDIYPNPSNGIININSHNKFNFKIKDLNGFEIINSFYDGDLKKIDISFLNNGLYFLEIFNGEIAEQIKIIKY